VSPLSGPADRQVKDLRGFTRVFLKAGEKKRLTFELRADRDMLRYSEERKKLEAALGEYEVQIGASSKDIRLKRAVRILPEAARVVEARR
jgi:beta-glucosidase